MCHASVSVGFVLKTRAFIGCKSMSAVPVPCISATIGGVERLISDLRTLSEDHESADIVFLVGPTEERIYAHRIMLLAR